MPTATWIAPLARSWFERRRGPCRVCRPVSSPTRTPSGSSQPRKLRACCSASSSVGAITAACAPFSTARSAASAATTVLPEPTSPCTSRIIGRSRARSAAISPHVRCCAPVSRNGSCARQRSTRSRAARQRPRIVAVRGLAQQAQADLVREQFLEREPPLGRVPARVQQLDVGGGRRTMHVAQRRLERRHARRDEHVRGRSSHGATRRTAARARVRSACACGPAARLRSSGRPASGSRPRAGSIPRRSSRYSGCTISSPPGPCAPRRSSAGACRATRPPAAPPRNERSAASANPEPSAMRHSSARRRRNTTSASCTSPSMTARSPVRSDPIGTTRVRSS